METLDVRTEKPTLFPSEKEKNWLRELLREQNVTVTFTKLDGSEREMVCTLSETQIPVQNHPKTAAKAKNDQVLAVFDVKNQGWRSFRWDSITKIELSIEGA
jgi:hypothetical protein